VVLFLAGEGAGENRGPDLVRISLAEKRWRAEARGYTTRVFRMNSL